MWNNFPLITNACARLQKVVIENKDFEKLIDQYDRPESFFYCDPPYFETEDYYEDVGFTKDDHIRLADSSVRLRENICYRTTTARRYASFIKAAARE